MKKSLFSMLLILGLLAANPAAAEPLTEIVPQNKPPSIMERAFLRHLGSTILDVMAAHGDNQLFTEERIEKIVRNREQDSYDVSLRAIGYEGALNPPYKLIKMTLRIPDQVAFKDYKVIAYKSRILKDERKYQK